MNNNNKKNKFLNIVAYVVLSLILLSFVFSSVALVRSYTADNDNVVYADEPVSDNFTVLNYIPSNNTFFNNSVFFGFSGNTLFTWLVSFYNSSDVLIMRQSCMVMLGNGGDTSVRRLWVTGSASVNESKNLPSVSGSSIFYVDWTLFDFYNNLNVSYLTYDFSNGVPDTNSYYRLIRSSDTSSVISSPNDNYDVYSLFNGAVATYTLDATISGSISQSYSAPVDIDIDANRVYFHTLFNKITYAVKEHAFVLNGELTAFDYLTITIPFNGAIDVFKLNFGFSPFVIESPYLSLVDFYNSSTNNINTFLKNYYGNLSLYSGDNFHNTFSDNNVGVWHSFRVNGIFPDDNLTNINSDNIQSVISVLDSMFFTYGSNYGLGYSMGYADAKAEFNSNYSNAYNLGFEDGKTEGIAQSNDYSFLSLIGAVVDAPVKAFTSLLNFNFLGINLLVFVTGLLTVVLIIWFIKKLIGGK